MIANIEKRLSAVAIFRDHAHKIPSVCYFSLADSIILLNVIHDSKMLWDNADILTVIQFRIIRTFRYCTVFQWVVQLNHCAYFTTLMPRYTNKVFDAISRNIHVAWQLKSSEYYYWFLNVIIWLYLIIFLCQTMKYFVSVSD